MCRNGCPRVLALATVLLVGLLVVLCNSYIFVERWPHGHARAIRQGIEAVLPPPPGSEFVEVVRRRPLDGAYSETLYYRSNWTAAEILEYYRAALAERGWTVRVRDDSLLGLERPLREATVIPVPSPDPGGPSVRIRYDESQSAPTAHISMHFWPVDSFWVSRPYTYIVGSESLIQAAKVLAQGQPGGQP